MICPVCKESGLKSTVWDSGTSSTLLGWMPYFDEEGKKHSHDPNRCSTVYTCSQGHRFVHRYHIACPTCGVVSDLEEFEVIRKS
jgi:hypothetical protein